METDTQHPKKRPVGFTILLILSLINACWNIFRGLVMFLTVPRLAEMMGNGQLEEMMQPFNATLSDEMRDAMTAGMDMMLQIDRKYWLFLALLFIASLIGVLRMFKSDKRGVHIYSIAQILLLINASGYLYPNQPQSGFLSDLMLTLIFIMLYYLHFKRMDLADNNHKDTDTL